MSTENSTIVVDTLDELTEMVGQDLGTGEWFEVDQARINAFADATDDDQWIHTDPEDVREVKTKVNYGFDRVRFPAPVLVGSMVRLRATLAAVDPVPGGVQITVDAVVERDGGDRPVCVAKPIFRFLA